MPLETRARSCSRDGKWCCMHKLPLLKDEWFISMIKNSFISSCITPNPFFFNLFKIKQQPKFSHDSSTDNCTIWKYFTKYHENTSSWREDYYEFRWVLVVYMYVWFKCTNIKLLSHPQFPSTPCTFPHAFLFRKECINLHLKKSSLYFLWFSAIFL